LVTDPPGAEVRLEKYVLRGRCLIAEDCGVLGVTPIQKMLLQKGSYRLRIEAAGRQEVKYPVLIERGGHWDGVRPGEREAYPVRLPELGELRADVCYVPAGWSWIGGDAEAADGLPSKRVWIDAFVIGRFPVTDRDYLEFLNDLLKSGRGGEAMRAIPQQSASTTERHEPIYPLTAEGWFGLRDGSPPDLPAVLMDWHSVSLHAKWLAEKTGCPVRLPDELEREKAARGVDGRLFPWGNHPDATFACALESHRGPPAREAVDTFPADESPYGIRGLAGNVREWCANLWRREGPRLDGGRLCLEPAPPLDDDFRIIRGGTWGSSITNSRSAARFGSRPEKRWLGVGLRVAWSYPGG
jgi:formylglycine-generating enzyme required for sulfatase activity